jgi:hypothetical protein
MFVIRERLYAHPVYIALTPFQSIPLSFRIFCIPPSQVRWGFLWISSTVLKLARALRNLSSLFLQRVHTILNCANYIISLKGIIPYPITPSLLFDSWPLPLQFSLLFSFNGLQFTTMFGGQRPYRTHVLWLGYMLFYIRLIWFSFLFLVPLRNFGSTSRKILLLISSLILPLLQHFKSHSSVKYSRAYRRIGWLKSGDVSETPRLRHPAIS